MGLSKDWKETTGPIRESGQLHKKQWLNSSYREHHPAGVASKQILPLGACCKVIIISSYGVDVSC